MVKIEITNPMYYVIQDWINNNITYHNYDDFLFDNNIENRFYDLVILPEELLIRIALESNFND